MGMSIDESIRVISYVKPKKPTSPSGMLKKNAFNTAIDTMRKYQKIEQILKDIPYGGEATVRRIQEVVEDGKID